MKDEFYESLQISLHPFSLEAVKELYNNNIYAQNSWPITYIIHDEKLKEAYVGESTNAISRMKSHLSVEERNRLKALCIIGSDKFNKSAVLDIESSLINYMAGDGKYQLQNSNSGLVDHNYYQRNLYKGLFKKIWKELQKENITVHDLDEIANSNLFKFSPYKSLSKDQYNAVLSILRLLNEGSSNSIFIEGSAGTGKTVLAIYLIKLLLGKLDITENEKEMEWLSEEESLVQAFRGDKADFKVALVIPMTSLRGTLKSVFKSIKGLSAKMVIGPTEVANQQYDLLIVDEAHRLKKRKNITNYKSFDDVNKKLGLPITGNELDWIFLKSKNQILFYDQDQSIRPSDVDHTIFKKIKTQSHVLKLESQMRVQGGVDYINFVGDLLNTRLEKGDSKFKSETYDLVLFDSLNSLVNELKIKENEFGLCRLLAGFAWEWKSKNKNIKDISIEGMEFYWNRSQKDWINSPNAINEVGCIHTSQGYDLNYSGVIFGEEITYNPQSGQIEIDSLKYFDKKGKAGIPDPNELKNYILNVYKTLMLRGIRGTFIYVCNKDLYSYFKNFI